MENLRASFTYEEASKLQTLVLGLVDCNQPFGDTGDRLAFMENDAIYRSLRRRLKGDDEASKLMPKRFSQCHDLDHMKDLLADMRGGPSVLKRTLRRELAPLLEYLEKRGIPDTHSRQEAAQAHQATSEEAEDPVDPDSTYITIGEKRITIGGNKITMKKSGASHLDLSEGKEPLIQIALAGWEEKRKRIFLERSRELRGVVSVRPAGGFTSVNIRFDPERTTSDILIKALSSLSHTMAASDAEFAPNVGGQNSILPEDHSILADSVGNILANEHAIVLHPSTEAFRQSVDSAEWTGIISGAQRLRIVADLFPSAIMAVDSLIYELEHQGGNGGPPLDDRATALETLRSLRDALTTILELADNGDLESGEALGLFGDASSIALRLKDMFLNDPLRCGLIGMTVAMATLLTGGGCAAAGIAVLGTFGSMMPSKGQA